MRAIELVAGASSYRVFEVEKSTTNGDVIVYRGIADGVVDVEDTTEGVKTIEGVGSRIPDPPSFGSTALCA